MAKQLLRFFGYTHLLGGACIGVSNTVYDVVNGQNLRNTLIDINKSDNPDVHKLMDKVTENFTEKDLQGMKEYTEKPWLFYGTDICKTILYGPFGYMYHFNSEIDRALDMVSNWP